VNNLKESGIFIITIDGPSGVGKGTVAQRLANALNWHFLDSGALYRVLALAAQRQGVSTEDTDTLEKLSESMPVKFRVMPDHTTRIYLNDEDVTTFLRTEQCGEWASKVAVIPGVRHGLLQRQRSFCQSPGLVADGRDMGTVVFPEATLKFFLNATANVRAERRYKQLINQGVSVNLTELEREILARDARDRNRLVSPLRPAEDAIKIDTTQLSANQVFEQVHALVLERIQIER